MMAKMNSYYIVLYRQCDTRQQLIQQVHTLQFLNMMQKQQILKIWWW